MGSVERMLEDLRSWRENCIRDPEALRDIWHKLGLIEKRLSNEEKWTVMEQFCFAGLDLHDEEIISTCLKRLNTQFPGSNRVRLLNIMSNCELTGNYDEAIKNYNDMIEDDETNAGARKRKIAILISQNKNHDAIRELCDYLRRFMNDQEAWKELCELYTLEQDYAKALYCMEELLLSHPVSYVYHTRLAELHYTQGGHESLDLARSYFHQAIKLNDKNVRALHGLHLALKSLLSGNRLTSQQRKELDKLHQWNKTTLNSVYETGGHPNVLKYMKLE